MVFKSRARIIVDECCDYGVLAVDHGIFKYLYIYFKNLSFCYMLDSSITIIPQNDKDIFQLPESITVVIEDNDFDRFLLLSYSTVRLR